MTKKSPPPEIDEPCEVKRLHPDYFYRRYRKDTLAAIGFKQTQIDEKVKSGELPPLVKLSESGRASGWYGSQLIELQRQRIAKAEALAAERRAEKTTPKRKAT